MDESDLRLDTPLSQNQRDIDLDVIYLITEFLANDRRTLKSCSLVSYFWFRPARRWLFRIIHLQSSRIRRFTTSPNSPPSESPFPVYEQFCKHLDSLVTDDSLRDTESHPTSARLKFDFRPFVEEVHFTGESTLMLGRTLSIYPGESWHALLYLRLSQVLQIVNHFPKLRVLAFRDARSFFSPTHHYNILWPVFWAFAPLTEELHLTNDSWTVGSIRGGQARIDLEKALGFPAPSGSCKIHTLYSDDLISRDVDHFFGKLADSNAILPAFRSLRLPITVLEKPEFGRALDEIGPVLEHLRFDMLAMRTCTSVSLSSSRLTLLTRCLPHSPWPQ